MLNHHCHSTKRSLPRPHDGHRPHAALADAEGHAAELGAAPAGLVARRQHDQVGVALLNVPARRAGMDGCLEGRRAPLISREAPGCMSCKATLNRHPLTSESAPLRDSPEHRSSRRTNVAHMALGSSRCYAAVVDSCRKAHRTLTRACQFAIGRADHCTDQQDPPSLDLRLGRADQLLLPVLLGLLERKRSAGGAVKHFHVRQQAFDDGSQVYHIALAVHIAQRPPTRPGNTGDSDVREAH